MRTAWREQVEEDIASLDLRSRFKAEGRTLVPEDKIRSRYRRLWALVAQARDDVDRATFYDNSSLDRPFRRVAVYGYGQLVKAPDWPEWTSAALL